MRKKINTDPKLFPIRHHKWQTFIISFHRNSFCYSGKCYCHDEDFDGKKMPYKLLAGKLAEYIEKVKVNCVDHMRMKHVKVRKK